MCLTLGEEEWGKKVLFTTLNLYKKMRAYSMDTYKVFSAKVGRGKHMEEKEKK